MMLEDEDYLDAVKSILDTQHVTAESAVTATGENFAAAFAAMDDQYMQARAADIRDISGRVVNILTGQGTAGMEMDQPVILMADDLTPSETVQLDRANCWASSPATAPPTAHTAILARTMNIPALIGVEFEEPDGHPAVLDG